MNYFAINKLAAILKLLLLSVPAKMFILFRSFNVYLFRFFAHLQLNFPEQVKTGA